MGRVRTLAAVLILIEAGLAGLWFWLVRFGLDNPDRVTPDFQTRVGEVLGAAMGGIAGLGLVLLILAWRRARPG